MELKAGILLAAHRFNRDPEHGLSAHPCQMGTNFIIIFFQLCLNKKNIKKKANWRIDSKSHIQSSSTSSFPLTSYLISDIMGKPDLYEGLLKDSWKRRALDMKKGDREPPDFYVLKWYSLKQRSLVLFLKCLILDFISATPHLCGCGPLVSITTTASTEHRWAEEKTANKYEQNDIHVFATLEPPHRHRVGKCTVPRRAGWARGVGRHKSESSLLAAACTLDHIFRIFRANRQEQLHYSMTQNANESQHGVAWN